MEITALGDSAVIVRLQEDREQTSTDALDAVLAAQRQLEQAKIPGVIEIATSYTTVALFFDAMAAVKAGAPSTGIFDWLGERIGKALATAPETFVSETRMVKVPVCYDDEFALDLEHVARQSGLGRQQAIDLHLKTEYRVHCLGFTAGFPYLGGLPQKLATPRRSIPRKEVPAGSVAIGGTQAGIYPAKSPGGWNIIGRTPLRLFAPEKNPPAFFSAGDRVRFRAITREEFDRLANEH